MKGETTQESWLQTCATPSPLLPFCLPQEALVWVGIPPWRGEAGLVGSGPWSHLSVLRGGRVVFCRRWASEVSVFTLSRSDSGVRMAPDGMILGKALSWEGDGQSEDLVLDQTTVQGSEGTQEDQGCNMGREPQRAVLWVPRCQLWLLGIPVALTA